jgi:hypothetical protein
MTACVAMPARNRAGNFSVGRPFGFLIALGQDLAHHREADTEAGGGDGGGRCVRRALAQRNALDGPNGGLGCANPPTGLQIPIPQKDPRREAAMTNDTMNSGTADDRVDLRNNFVLKEFECLRREMELGAVI